MFNCKYFLSYEILKSRDKDGGGKESVLLKGHFVVSVPLFGSLEYCIEDFIIESARINQVDTSDIILINLSKLN